MFRELLAHPQEAHADAELVAIVTGGAAPNNHQFCVRVGPPKDGQVMPETCRDNEHQ
jgi:hypothetical protein